MVFGAIQQRNTCSAAELDGGGGGHDDFVSMALFFRVHLSVCLSVSLFAATIVFISLVEDAAMVEMNTDTSRRRDRQIDGCL